MRHKDIDVVLRGVELSVKYSYVPRSPAVVNADPFDSLPPEGGYVDDAIFFAGGADITEVIDNDIKEQVYDLICAEEEGR